ncbi:hypothetical protein SUGI_1123990 [Cryptomeria japonica]|nr:hypothetical protein SUGI_1123990 [Cryptomeria japonica]
MYLQPWTPNFNPIPLAMYSCPKWVSLYNLPIKYWGEIYLEKIDRMLGMMLEIDFDDKDDLCKLARIRVAAIRCIPEYISLHSANGAWRQLLEIEKEIHQCSRCGSKFHGAEDCRLFVRKARIPFRKSMQLWRRKLEKMVMDSFAETQEV